MTGILQKLSTLPQLRELTAALTGRERCAAVTGLSPVHRAMLSAAVAAETRRPLLLLCADEKECARQAADLQVLLDGEPVRLPERELQLRPAAYSRQWENSRLSALCRMAQGESPVVVATASAMAQRCPPRDVLLSVSFSLEVGQRYDVRALCARLTAAGYTRTEQVEGAGQFALRGGILDVFSPGEERPLRCEFFDDELDSMGEFEVSTQPPAGAYPSRRRAAALRQGGRGGGRRPPHGGDGAPSEEGARCRAAAYSGRRGASASGRGTRRRRPLHGGGLPR